MSRRGSERSSCGAIATNAGCVTVPARFFPPGRLIAVFPPIAAVDAAIGGKTAINLPGGKNLAGTVTQPAFVAIAPQLLRSLPRRDIVSGYGEMLKYGLALDAGLYRALRAGESALLEDPATALDAIARCVELKAAIVARDEEDRSGTRAVLNFGHTVGHALEKVAGYGAHPDDDGLAVAQRAVAGDLFEGVSDGVPEVQDCARPAAVLFVARDDRGFELDAARDRVERRRRILEQRAFARAQRAVEAGIEREPVLEHLAVARDDVAARERAQQLRRDRDERRLRHRPRQVLSAGQVDRGLPADRGVDRREQRRRNADVRNAALKRRRREPDRVADRSAADADDAAAPVEAGGDEAFVPVSY